MKITKKRLIGLIKEALEERPAPTTGDPEMDQTILAMIQNKAATEEHIQHADFFAQSMGYSPDRSFAIDYRDWVIDKVSLVFPNGSDILEALVDYGQAEGTIPMIANVKRKLEKYGIQGLTMNEHQEYSAIWAELIWVDSHNLLFLRMMP